MTLVVPTLRRSPWWRESIDAAGAAADRWLVEGPDRQATVVVVDQSGDQEPPVDDRSSDRGPSTLHWIAVERPIGFARAANIGWRHAVSCDADLVGWINDDLLVDSDWLQQLVAVLDRHDFAAVQGLVLDAEARVIDSAGVSWNKGHQAVQLRHGEPPGAWRRRRELTGELAGDLAGDVTDSSAGLRSTETVPLQTAAVSAAAALYRVDALAEVSNDDGPFDQRLDTFYEDVDLSLRLADRELGCAFLWSAQARHLGSATAGSDQAGKASLLVGNRWRVLMRASGRGALRHAPRALLRDLTDLLFGRLSRLGILRGWWRALTGIPAFGHLGEPGLGWRRRAGETIQLTPTDLGSEHTVHLQAVVVHWQTEDALAAMVDSWQRAARALEHGTRASLVVVDNGSRPSHSALVSSKARFQQIDHWTDPVDREGTQLLWLDPGRNLGFGRAVNWGALAVRNSQGDQQDRPALEVVLLLNPDIVLDEDFLVELSRAARKLWSGAAASADSTIGLVPALRETDGSSQAPWQLRPLPRPIDLLAQACFLSGRLGPAVPPDAGSIVEQPAAAALAIEGHAFDALGGFDEGFWPAWYEDVDFAARAADVRGRFRYLPTASAEHRQGESVHELGYGRFLRIYGRNLRRYAHRRHGALLALLVTLAQRKAAFARLLTLLLPLPAPRRAHGRRAAARALLGVALGTKHSTKAHH